MTNSIKPSAKSLSWGKSFWWLAVAVASFHAAYTLIHFPAAGLLIFGYAMGLVQLTNQPTVRRAFYFGLTTGFLCYAPQLYFFWNIFGPAAIVLWLLLAFWIGLFAAIVCGCIRCWGKVKAAWLIPIVWIGLEYFRSELYYLKFSWLNIGYAFPNYSLAPLDIYGMYCVGFLIVSAASILSCFTRIKRVIVGSFLIVFLLLIGLAYFLQLMTAARFQRPIPPLSIAGVQMEFPSPGVLPKALDKALTKNPDAQIFVLSEYTLDGPVPGSLKNWCREHLRFLVVGGEELLGTTNFYDTAFVIGTNGEVVFKQVKSVPIQFFKDGLPAPEQKVWESPWGKIGFCICYDLSYTRVTDRLVKQGAQLLIVPTMDVESWGRHEHELHTRVAPVRAAEYGIPIFRLASSGISQVVDWDGKVIAQAPFPGNVEILSAKLRLPMHGSLPLDRYLEPLCVSITAIVTAVLLFLAWNDKRARSANSAAKEKRR
jgi:apolipoprotein N-acyltransferase